MSHRSFMPKLLIVNPPKGWPHVQRLLVGLFKFLEPYLRNAELGETIHFLYKGTLRVLLVLLHDFPEFLCDYYFSFCDVIPSSCIQLRNVILGAFPHNMRLPDPSTPNLKIDLLAEINQSPRIFSEVDAALKAKQMKSDVDEYLKVLWSFINAVHSYAFLLLGVFFFFFHKRTFSKFLVVITFIYGSNFEIQMECLIKLQCYTI
ncbi:hypothetical protein ACSBR1_039637 [Camellia fascicularis]